MRKHLLLLMVTTVTLAACSSATGKASTSTSSPASTSTPASTSAPTSTTTTTRAGPSAYDQLAGFVRAAGEMDAQLKHAAELINGAGPPWTSPLPAAVVAAVQAADLHPVAAAIPAGLPEELLRRTILVYSDLASRYFAMRWFGPEGFPYLEPNPEAQSELESALADGAPAAARFASDLDGVVRAARASPPFTVAAPTSRAAADVLLLVQWTDGMNGGCASTGGAVLATLPEIVWTTRGDVSGTIAGVGFGAELVEGSWQVTIFAC